MIEVSKARSIPEFPSQKLSSARLIASPTRAIEQHDAVPIRVVHLQIPFVGAAEVERRERFSAGDLLQHSVGQSRATRLQVAESPQADREYRQVLGYDASMMNALNILPSYTEYFHLTSATIALNSGIVWIGAVFGSIILAKVPDIIGRKPSIFYAALVAILGSGIQAAAQNISMFLVARFILGLGIGGTYVSVPLLIAETLPTKYRSLGLGAFTDLYYVGGLLSAGEQLEPPSPHAKEN
jgi:hypothetical protein